MVDHGSRRAESNHMLLEVVRLFQTETGYSIVEPAHMELAEPSIATAWDKCVQRGAKHIVVHPFFLFPGRHWSEDIPRLTAAAARNYPEIRYLVSAPLGVHSLITSLARLRIENCLEFASKNGNHNEDCPFCNADNRCQFRPNLP